MYSNVDWIAERLMRIGAIGRNMPPSWDGAKIAVPVVSPSGEARIGKVLPGRGLYLDSDLKSIGIRKPLPFVFEKTPVMRLVDTMRSERAAIAAAGLLVAASLFSRNFLHHLVGPIAFGTIATYDGIINARANGKAYDVTFTKSSITTVASAWAALFDAGGLPGAGSYTASPGSAPTNATTGALSFGIPNPSGSDKAYLLTFGWTSSQQLNMAIVADLLVQVGSITVAGTGFTVNSTALTRYTSGAGVLMTFEVTTALGGTASNLTVTYTNQSGTGSQSSGAQALTTSAIVGRLQPTTFGPYCPLASSDYGVQSVQTATTSASMVGGALALHLYYPLAFVPGVASQAYIERDSTVQIDGLTQLVTTGGGALGCLALYVLPNTTSSGTLTGFMRTCQG